MPQAHRIDVQHHILPPAYVRLVGEEAIARLVVSGRVPSWSPEISLEAMNRNGIELAITSVSAPGFALDDPATAAKVARQCNEYAAELCRLHPGRFGMFATLPLPHVAQTLEEIAYSLDTLHADGVCLLTNYDNHYLGEAHFAPVLEELNCRGAVVFVHPADISGQRPLEHIPAATLEFPFDTTRAIVSMLVSGALTRSRDARFIFSHAGGTLPYLADRIARLQRRSEFNRHIPDGVIFELERLYFDTALSASKRIFASLRQIAAPDRILFASDYPFAAEDTMTATIAGLSQLDLPPGELAGIERANALKLMPDLLTKHLAAQVAK